MALLAVASVVAACSGRALDVGGGSDGGREDGAAPDTGALADAEPDVSVPLPPVGFFLQGVPCTITGESVDGLRWPTWSIAVDATCDSRGYHLLVVSNATITYPQRCSIATEVVLRTIEPEIVDSATPEGGVPPSDAGASIQWQASSLRGSCDIMIGPTTASPSSVIALRATVVSPENGALDLTYHSRTPD